MLRDGKEWATKDDNLGDCMGGGRGLGFGGRQQSSPDGTGTRHRGYQDQRRMDECGGERGGC